MNGAKRILVTGGAGFIGSHTVQLLLKEGHQVTVLDNLSSGKLENLNLQHPDLSFIEGDVLEYPLVEELADVNDAVLHLAAIASVPLSLKEPIYTFQVNTQGFLHVLEAVFKARRPIRLVYASSASVYGDNKGKPCLDSMPLESLPLSPYALQKIHAENYAALYSRLHGVPSLGLRYFNVYGSRQDPLSPYSGVITRFLEAYQAESELVIFGDGKQSRDFIDVKEVAKANLLALQHDYSGLLNIATGKAETLLQLTDYLAEAGQKPVNLHFEPARPGDIKSSIADVALAQKELAFSSTISLEAGIKRMLEGDR